MLFNILIGVSAFSVVSCAQRCDKIPAAPMAHFPRQLRMHAKEMISLPSLTTFSKRKDTNHTLLQCVVLSNLLVSQVECKMNRKSLHNEPIYSFENPENCKQKQRSTISDSTSPTQPCIQHKRNSGILPPAQILLMK